MRKTISSAVILTCLFMPLSSLCAADDILTHLQLGAVNGTKWKKMAQKEKLSYIDGFYAGINTSYQEQKSAGILGHRKQQTYNEPASMRHRLFFKSGFMEGFNYGDAKASEVISKSGKASGDFLCVELYTNYPSNISYNQLAILLDDFYKDYANIDTGIVQAILRVIAKRKAVPSKIKPKDSSL